MEMKENGFIVRPCIQMTVQLMSTYKRINMVYYKSRRAKQVEKIQTMKNISTNVSKENDILKRVDKIMADHYIPIENEIFHQRYRITGKKLGMGTFGQVLEAIDEETSKPVALKIIKNQPLVSAQAQTEIKILEYMHTSPNGDRCHIVKLLDKFKHKGHDCLIFPLCSYNLYELLRSGQFKGVGLKLIRKFAKQIIESIQFLTEVGIIHCDLKPENIVIERPNRSNIKIIDFGSSCRTDKRVYSYIQSRFYRAPEVIMGLKYSNAIDMWSVGCILIEMHTGSPLFVGQDIHDQLKKIVDVLGTIPSHLVDQANPNQRSEYFERIIVNGAPTREYKVKRSPSSKLQSLSLADNTSTTPSRSLYDIVTLDGRRMDKETDHSREDYAHFYDLVKQMLEIDPARRITPMAALHHPFFLSQMQTSRSRIPSEKKRTTGIEHNDVNMTMDEHADQTYSHRAKQRKLLLPNHDV